jgi:uncharacterized protein (DUF2237 family)
MNKLQKNVLGGPLRTCCMDPVTGYMRNGLCELQVTDGGQHTICIVATDTFLSYSKSVGNDLSTPYPEYEFSGLKAGDKWCLCALRWKEAYDAGCAPTIILSATHESMLNIVSLEILRDYALDKDIKV